MAESFFKKKKPDVNNNNSIVKIMLINLLSNIHCLRFISRKPNTIEANPNESNAALLIVAGRMARHTKHETDEITTRNLSNFLRRLFSPKEKAPRIAISIASRPPYGPGLEKLPVRAKTTLPEGSFPNNCNTPLPPSYNARTLTMSIEKRRNINSILRYRIGLL